MFLWAALIGIAVLAHTAPFHFLLDVTDHTVWRMPQTDPPTIYLTFDDGPNPAVTSRLLALFDRYSARVTFFLVGKYARACPDLCAKWPCAAMFWETTPRRIPT